MPPSGTCCADVAAVSEATGVAEVSCCCSTLRGGEADMVGGERDVERHKAQGRLEHAAPGPEMTTYANAELANRFDSFLK